MKELIKNIWYLIKVSDDNVLSYYTAQYSNEKKGWYIYLGNEVAGFIPHTKHIEWIDIKPIFN